MLSDVIEEMTMLSGSSSYPANFRDSQILSRESMNKIIGWRADRHQSYTGSMNSGKPLSLTELTAQNKDKRSFSSKNLYGKETNNLTDKRIKESSEKVRCE